ncbi:MAG: alpha/beta fold hydrolase [Chloroflexi bacterium]|nr:MAG: alpha/beta fold hydrolase [Chloroflexota bacterium]
MVGTSTFPAASRTHLSRPEQVRLTTPPPTRTVGPPPGVGGGGFSRGWWDNPGVNESEGTVEFRGWRTWYRVTGSLDPSSPLAPIVLLHGGPGATHDYLDAMRGLAGSGRAVVQYDQLGNGRSTHLRDRGADFWTVGLFCDELHNLLAGLGLAGDGAAGRGYHLLGQSWGGCLALEHALRQPPGLRSLVLADTLSSVPDFAAECQRLLAGLPPDVQATIRRHEEAGTTADPAYVEACMVFYKRHVCRLDTWPDEVLRSFQAIDDDPTVYGTMNGPSEFTVIGTIRDWQVTERLGEIRVPTLIVSGRHDETTPRLQETLRDGIAGSEWVCFEDSSHMPHLEEPERWLETVGAFLGRAD